MSPFRLRRRIGPRPAFLGVDATVKVVGAAPFVEPERRFGTFDYFAARPLATSSLRFRRMNQKSLVCSMRGKSKQRGVDWQFKIDNARRKLKRLYPKIKT